MSFNPDQPRDERGRFASDGGGGSSVGKSSGSGPRPVTRGPVQKLSSGHSEATQKTVEQARKYFAKEGRGKVVGSFGDPRKIAREKYGPTPRRQASESGWQFKLRTQSKPLDYYAVKVGTRVHTPDGPGTISHVHTGSLDGAVNVRLANGRENTYRSYKLRQA